MSTHEKAPLKGLRLRVIVGKPLGNGGPLTDDLRRRSEFFQIRREPVPNYGIQPRAVLHSSAAVSGVQCLKIGELQCYSVGVAEPFSVWAISVYGKLIQEAAELGDGGIAGALSSEANVEVKGEDELLFRP